MAQAETRYNIRAVDRGLQVLSVLSDGKPRTLTELSEAMGLNSSSTFRFLATLAFHRYVERNEQTGAYHLGLACLELARAYLGGSDVRRAALPYLEKLRDDSTETIHLAVLDKMEVVYLEKLHGLHAVGLMTSRVGGRSPAYCTGLGKVLLAYTDFEEVRVYFCRTGLHRYTSTTIQSVDDLLVHLQQIRSQGYALDQGEHETEIRCVAVPIFDLSEQVVAALSIAGPAGRLDPLQTKQALIDQAVQAAAAISARLGYRSTD